MTGRRAVRQWDERLSRALQFVPGHVGGRVASAQPIRRRGGTLRQASVGAVKSPLSVVGHTNAFVFSTATSYDIPTTGLVAGDLVLAWATGRTETFTAPAGWTTLFAESSGNLDVWAGWLRLDGTDDTTLSRAGDDTFAVSSVRLTGVADMTPTATSRTTALAASSIAMHVPSSGWGIQTVVAIYEPADVAVFSTPNASDGWAGDAGYYGDDQAYSWYLNGNPSAQGNIRNWHAYEGGDPGGASYFVGAGPHPGTWSLSQYGSPYAADALISFALAVT